jgi:TPR repeat protein
VALADAMGVKPFDGVEAVPAVPFWYKACHDGVGDACKNIAQTFQNSELTLEGEPRIHEGRKDQLQLAFLYYMKRACGLEDSHCVHWADHAADDPLVNQAESQEAWRVLESNCQAATTPYACSALGHHYKYEDSSRRDLARSRQSFRRACDLGSNKAHVSCGEAGLMLFKGVGGPPDHQAGASYLAPLCSPTSEAWASQCSGDASSYQESCKSTWLFQHAASCVLLADHWVNSGDQAKADLGHRLHAALCSPVSFSEPAQAAARSACEQTASHMQKIGAPAAQREAVARRHCELQEKICYTRADNLGPCTEREAACLEEHGLQP